MVEEGAVHRPAMPMSSVSQMSGRRGYAMSLTPRSEAMVRCTHFHLRTAHPLTSLPDTAEMRARGMSSGYRGS